MLIQLWLAAPCIIKVNLVQGLEVVIFSSIGSIVNLSWRRPAGVAYTKSGTPSLANGMQEAPGVGLTSIRYDQPIWVCAPVSSIAK